MSNIISRQWRLVDSGIVSPAFSAAADEAILNSVVREDVPDTLHFYIRDRPAVSIGCNTRLEGSVNMDELRRRAAEVVRRISGGSAVYTDPGQLIFSLAMRGSELPSDINKSYEVVCSAIIAGISSFGIVAEHKPINDIVVGGAKISGSAQIRRGGAVLHHGTLLVDADIAAIEAVIRPRAGKGENAVHNRMTTMRDLLGTSPDMMAVKEAITGGICNSFGISIVPGELTAPEKEEALLLMNEKYGARSWNYGR